MPSRLRRSRRSVWLLGWASSTCSLEFPGQAVGDELRCLAPSNPNFFLLLGRFDQIIDSFGGSAYIRISNEHVDNIFV